LKILCSLIDRTSFKMLATCYSPELMKTLGLNVKLVGKVPSKGARDDELV
jgi:hypothetical protein